MVYSPFLPQDCMSVLLLVVTNLIVQGGPKIVIAFARLTDLRGHLAAG